MVFSPSSLSPVSWASSRLFSSSLHPRYHHPPLPRCRSPRHYCHICVQTRKDFFFFFFKRFLSKPYQKEKKKKKTHSSAMSSSSSPGLKDTSGEKKYRFLLHSKAMKRAKYSGMIRSTAWLTTVTIGLVSLLSDFTLLLHPLQISIVLILVGVAVATGCLYVLHVNTHAQPQRLQYTAPSIRWR